MIYFDNAATGGFKPNAVLDTTFTTLKYLSANPGRSGHMLSVTGAKRIFETRESIANFFSCEPERVAFTKNCTEALNLAIFGTLKKGGHVITTIYEHNSVLRPLYYLEKLGLITLSIVSPAPDLSLATAIEAAFTKNTYLVVASAVSNVTGEILPLDDIKRICKEKGALLLVDGAQGAGHIPLKVQDGINMIAFAGHKGLYGVMGSGGLVFNKDTDISPFILGGTGVDTFSTFAPTNYPERLETGTLNLPAICALKVGVEYVSRNLDTFASHLLGATKKVIDELSLINGIKIYSKANPSGIVSFELENLPSTEVSDILDKEFDVAVRGGFHCAPKMHEFLHTAENGLVRVSLAVQNSSLEIDYFLSAIKKLATREFV